MPRAHLIAALLLVSGVAAGQTVPPAAPGPSPAPSPTVPEVMAPGRPIGPTPGVIHPPDGLDPGIRLPAPTPEMTPGMSSVIPPPGTPGGDPRVQPR